MHLSLLDKYLIRQAAVAALVVCFVGTMVVWLTQALRLLELVVDRGAPVSMLLYMMVLTVPAFLSIVLPLALAIGILFALYKLMMDSELVVMRSAGMSHWRLARPFLQLALIVLILGYGVSMVVAPQANRTLAREEFLAKNDFALVLLRDGAFNRLNDNVTAYVRERVGAEEIRGLLLHDESKPDRTDTLIAERGVMVDTPAGKRVVLLNGVRQERNRETGYVNELRFEQYTLDLSQFGSRFDMRNSPPREMTTLDLLSKSMTRTDDTYWRKLAAEVHGRIAMPLLVLGYTVLALALLLTATINRRGMIGRLVTAAAIIILWQVAAVTSVSFIPRSYNLIYVLYGLILLPLPYLLSALVRGRWGLGARL